MKRHLCTLLLGSTLAVSCFGANITIYNTGESSNFTLATQGVADPNYTTIGSTVYVLSSLNENWIAPDATARYVGPDTGDGSTFSGGVYSLEYRISFDLTGLDPSTAFIQGKWSADNFGTNILINGVSTGESSSLASDGFLSFTTFTIDTGFVLGINTLDFDWANSGGPGGLLVEFTSATADPTPEPGSQLLMSLGLLALALVVGARRYAMVFSDEDRKIGRES